MINYNLGFPIAYKYNPDTNDMCVIDFVAARVSKETSHTMQEIVELWARTYNLITEEEWNNKYE